MVDSGSEPNIIKSNSLSPETVVDRNEILKLSGITAHHVTTLGLAQIDILGCPVGFHLVEDNFPIPQNGILGSDFQTISSKCKLPTKLSRMERY